ncbi:MAG: MtnX-like HAD-IB family phosphatase [bacterium]|nr:MtnX-like HAD-IB family phosphatase [Candidatus Kapabacteria bacterium]
MINTLHIFCDFDGTIATADIGDGIFDRFGVREPWHTQLMSGELNIRDYWMQMALNVSEALTLDAIDEYLRSIPIDPGFGQLVEFAREHSIALTVASDGFDIYINRYLTMHGFADVDVWCNHAELDGNGRLVMTFPYAAEGCTCMTASCKRNVVMLRSNPNDRIVYIGDGVSDFCPAEHADIIFAKKTLAAYCNANRLPHYPYATLDEVAKQLGKVIQKRRVNVRHQAALLRKKAWENA